MPFLKHHRGSSRMVISRCRRFEAERLQHPKTNKAVSCVEDDNSLKHTPLQVCTTGFAVCWSVLGVCSWIKPSQGRIRNGNPFFYREGADTTMVEICKCSCVGVHE